jgi:hypothetical protein
MTGKSKEVKIWNVHLERPIRQEDLDKPKRLPSNQVQIVSYFAKTTVLAK